jgi:hypothetical protein
VQWPSDRRQYILSCILSGNYGLEVGATARGCQGNFLDQWTTFAETILYSQMVWTWKSDIGEDPSLSNARACKIVRIDSVLYTGYCKGDGRFRNGLGHFACVSDVQWSVYAANPFSSHRTLPSEVDSPQVPVRWVVPSFLACPGRWGSGADAKVVRRLWQHYAIDIVEVDCVMIAADDVDSSSPHRQCTWSG